MIRRKRLALVAVAVLGGGCGGGGGGGSSVTSPVVPTAPATVSYPQSQVLGKAGAQAVIYTAAAATALPLADGTPLTAEYAPGAPAGVRVGCVSGDGSNIGPLRNVNVGVLTVSRFVLLAAPWQAIDADAAWTAAAAKHQVWKGWENCGVKPEGAPSPSSALTPASDGGYAEDLYIGNPSTNFTTVRQPVSAADAAAMRGASGFATREDPSRPLLITWRAFSDGAGHTIWVERGEPAAGAPAGTQGFITLFLPDS